MNTTRCRCGEPFADTLDGRHRHRLLHGHTPAPVTGARLTGTRWDGVTNPLPKGRRRER